MDEGLGDGDDAFDVDNKAAVTGALHFQEDAFVTFQGTGCYADAGSLGKIQFLGKGALHADQLFSL